MEKTFKLFTRRIIFSFIYVGWTSKQCYSLILTGFNSLVNWLLFQMIITGTHFIQLLDDRKQWSYHVVAE